MSAISEEQSVLRREGHRDRWFTEIGAGFDDLDVLGNDDVSVTKIRIRDGTVCA